MAASDFDHIDRSIFPPHFAFLVTLLDRPNSLPAIIPVTAMVASSAPNAPDSWGALDTRSRAGPSVADDAAIARALQAQFDAEVPRNTPPRDSLATSPIWGRTSPLLRPASFPPPRTPLLPPLLSGNPLHGGADDFSSFLASLMATMSGQADQSCPSNDALDAVKRSLPTGIIKAASAMISRRCIICCDEFVAGDKFTTLPCFHCYHSACIDEWLSHKALCPECNNPVGAPSDSDSFI